MTVADPARAEERRHSDRRTNRRRGAGARRMIDTTVPSPCVQICQIDKARNQCTGCKLSLIHI